MVLGGQLKQKYRQIARLVDIQIASKLDRKQDRQTDIQKDRYIDRQMNRQIDRWNCLSFFQSISMLYDIWINVQLFFFVGTFPLGILLHRMNIIFVFITPSLQTPECQQFRQNFIHQLTVFSCISSVSLNSKITFKPF